MKKRISAVLLACLLLLCSCKENASSVTESISTTPSTTTTSTTDTTTATKSTTTTTTSSTTTATPVATTTDTTTSTTTSDTTTTSTAETTSNTTTATTAETTIVTTTNTTTTSESTTATTTTSNTTTATTTATTTTEKQKFVHPESPIDPESVDRLIAYGIDVDKRMDYYQRLYDATDLPVIHVSTENEQEILSREEYVNCLIDVFNCEEQYILEAKEAGIRIRGNSTAYYGEVSEVRRNQVPYRIKFNKKENMLGLNDGAECKSWVLMKAPWNVMPDYIAFTLAERIMEGKYYSSDCIFTYVYVNEKFKGLYLLCEQNQINKHRVDLPEVPKDYKGTDIGYFLELDNYATENPYYFTVDYCGETLTDINRTERALVPAEYTIKNDVYSQKQVDFISNYINDVYRLMVEAIKYDKYYAFDSEYNLLPTDKYDNAYDAINAVVDLESVVKMYILYEICHDNDCGEGSFYMAVDFSGESSFDRLTFTAPWDFNWAYGDSPKGYYAGAFNAESFVNQYGDRSNPWFILLMSTDWFRDMVEEEWNRLYNNGAFTDAIHQWESTLAEYEDDLEIEGVCYADNIRSLIKWVKNRIKWLNSKWGYE